jgi:hypothetical protein
MWRFSGVVTIGACTTNGPVQAKLICPMLKYAFRKRAAANITKANHKNFHVRKDMEVQLPDCG